MVWYDVGFTAYDTGVPGRVGKFLILHIFKYCYLHFQYFARSKPKNSGITDFFGDARFLFGEAGL